MDESPRGGELSLIASTAAVGCKCSGGENYLIAPGIDGVVRGGDTPRPRDEGSPPLKIFILYSTLL